MADEIVEEQQQRWELPVRKSTPTTDAEIELGSFTDLTGEKKVQRNHMKYLNLQLLKIKYKKGDSGKFGTKYKYGSNAGKTSNVSYERLFICRVLHTKSTTECKRIVYLVQKSSGDKTNKNLFEECFYMKNHVLTIGSIFRLPSIKPVTEYWGENPVIVSNAYAHLCHFPMESKSVPIDISPKLDEMFAFTTNNCTLEMYSFDPVETPCGGKNCDKQDPNDCACYQKVETTRSNMTIQINLGIQSPEFEIIPYLKDNGLDVDFSSRQMMSYFVTGPLPDKMSSIALRNSEHYIAIEKAAQKVFDEVNKDDKGWTVYGWYKASSSTDNAVGDMDAGERNIKTASGDIKFHVSHIHPGDREFLDMEKEKGKALHKLKYVVEKINDI